MAGVLTTDDIYPRNDEERYRIYVVYGGTQRTIVATAGEPCGVAQAIWTILGDSKEAGIKAPWQIEGASLGIYDSIEREWVVAPW